jgi:hypothetical protein
VKPQEAAYRRRTAMTIFPDTLRLAEERLHVGRNASGDHFWETEAARMRWVLRILREHPTGSVKR